MIGRVRRAFGGLAPEQRLAAIFALALLVTLFLPWYETIGIPKGQSTFVHDKSSAIFKGTFIELAILLIVVAVLVMLFARGEDRRFHLPGGDGNVLIAAGGWTVFLIGVRFFDRPGVANDLGSGTVNLQFGIYLATLAAVGLAFAGYRLRLADVVEPPLPGEGPEAPTGADRRARRQSGRERPGAELVPEADPGEAPTRRVPRPPRDDAAPTSIAPAAAPTVRRPERLERPEIDGGTQLSFDEQE
jgi:hypothetical protein